MNADDIAREYWHSEIKPNMGDLWQDGLDYLCDQYVTDAQANPAAWRQIMDWAREKGIA